MREPAPVDLSIVIPAYNEAGRLPANLERLRAYLSTRDYTYEVIIADDGSVDNTAGLAEDVAARWPAVHVIRLSHLGKGGAVRSGIARARGSHVLIADADFSMPPEGIAAFEPEAFGDSDILIGSREAPGAQRFDEPAHRHFMGRAFNLLVRTLLLPGIQDSQCGFKCLRAPVAQELCTVQTINGWGFDVEWLTVARRRGWVIREVPVRWYFSASSRIHPIRSTVSMLREVLTIRRQLRHGHYDATPAPRAIALAEHSD